MVLVQLRYPLELDGSPFKNPLLETQAYFKPLSTKQVVLEPNPRQSVRPKHAHLMNQGGLGWAFYNVFLVTKLKAILTRWSRAKLQAFYHLIQTLNERIFKYGAEPNIIINTQWAKAGWARVLPDP